MPSELRLVSRSTGHEDEEQRHTKERALPADAAAFGSFRVAGWTAHPELARLSNGNRSEQLEPRVMHVLVCLASRPGAVVARQELLDTVWHDVVVGEDVLSRAVSILRQLFGESASQPKYIETIRGRGYRLVSAVDRICDGSATAVARLEDDHRESDAPPETAAPRPVWRSLLLVPALVGLLVAGAFLVTLWQLDLLHRGNEPAAAPREVQLTASTGFESFPAFSPDGVRIAFAAGNGSEPYDLFCTQRDTEPVLLAGGPGLELFPTWSPDGGTIAFARRESGVVSLCTVPAIKGPVRTLATVGRDILGLDWSPDGTYLVVAALPLESRSYRLFRLTLADLELSLIPDPAGDTFMVADQFPAIAPDGATLAFVRSGRVTLTEQLCTMAIEGGEPRCLETGLSNFYGLDWLPDGEHLVTSATTGKTGESNMLWEVAVKDGSTRWVPTLRAPAFLPTVDRKSMNLVYENRAFDYDILRYRHDGSQPEIFLTSTRDDRHPVVSHDGRHIAFVSDRAGSWHVWLCDAEGQSLRQLMPVESRLLRLFWSEDDRHLMVTTASPATGTRTVQLVEAETGKQRLLSAPEGRDFHVASYWSTDDWVYTEARVGEQMDLWRMRPNGEEAQRLDLGLPHDDLLGVRFFDNHLYYSSSEKGGLWRLALGGGKPQQIVGDAELVKRWVAWITTGTEIHFFINRTDDPPGLEHHLLDLESGRSQMLGVLPPASVGAPELCLAGDATHLLLALPVRGYSDLILIESLQGRSADQSVQ